MDVRSWYDVVLGGRVHLELGFGKQDDAAGPQVPAEPGDEV
jgi:hypothetical protein